LLGFAEHSIWETTYAPFEGPKASDVSRTSMDARPQPCVTLLLNIERKKRDATAGLKLVAPDDGWRRRPDMDPPATRYFRASIVARARFIEDLVVEQAGHGVGQYVILGAGWTLAQRRPEIASRLLVFEVDQPGPQAWKRHRLIEFGFGIPEGLRLVPVDFEAGEAWWQRLAAAGFDAGQPAVVASTGVSMYLTKDAIAATLRKVASLATGSTLAMTFLLPLELADPEVRPGLQLAEKGARASGTPFISFFTPTEMLTLARLIRSAVTLPAISRSTSATAQR
jgi:methyltransferase (TIGR00027 family)